MRLIKLVAICILTSVFTQVAAARDLSAQEIIDKHLASIGTKEKRDSLQTLMAVGMSEFESRSPLVKGGGKALMVSNPNNLYFLMSFNSREYPLDKIGFFGDKMSLPFLSSGARSLLGAFLADNSKILSDGLLSGGMSLRWPLLGMDKKKVRVEAGGTKKVNGRKAYVVEFNPPGAASSVLTTKMYFDAETFNHVRTEYQRVIDAGNVTFKQQNQTSTSVLNLTEVFGDFLVEDGLNLPHSYKVTFMSNSGNDNETSWGMKVTQYYFNQQLAPDFFTFDTK